MLHCSGAEKERPQWKIHKKVQQRRVPRLQQPWSEELHGLIWAQSSGIHLHFALALIWTIHLIWASIQLLSLSRQTILREREWIATAELWLLQRNHSDYCGAVFITLNLQFQLLLWLEFCYISVWNQDYNFLFCQQKKHIWNVNFFFGSIYQTKSKTEMIWLQKPWVSYSHLFSLLFQEKCDLWFVVYMQPGATLIKFMI